MAVTIGLVWLLSVGVAQVRTVDAARETARAVARGDDPGEAVARGQRVAPEGAEVAVTTTEGEVVVTASGHVAGSGRAVLVPAGRGGQRGGGGGRRGGLAMRRPDDRGAATVFAVACLAVLLLIGSALGVVAAMVRAHRTAQAAADLAALAAASALARGRDPCGSAADIAAANGAELLSCTIDGQDALVTVEVAGPRWLGQDGDLGAEARAGPAG